MDLIYRYTSPIQQDGSRLVVHLNNQFMQDYPLTSKDTAGQQLMQGLQDNNRQLTIPALRLGVVNQLRFNFDYAHTFVGGTADGRCETVTTVGHHVVIDDRSSIDFSGYRHYIEMPSLGSIVGFQSPFHDQHSVVALLADPAYRARFDAVDNGANADAIATLTAALKANPNDAELMGAIGQAETRVNNRTAAISWLQKAIQAGQASTQVGRWQSLLQTNRYWLAINNGDAALKKGDVTGENCWAMIGLGDMALARGDARTVLERYQLVQQQDSNHIDAALGRIEALIALQHLNEALRRCSNSAP